MAAAWVWTDSTIEQQLQAWIDEIADEGPWVYHLFKNDIPPEDMHDLGEYVEADFSGYVSAEIPTTGFGAPAVADHVATSTNSTNAVYTASGGATDQDIYGYYIMNADDVFVGAEKFSAAQTVHPGQSLTLTPRLKNKTCGPI